MTDDQMLQMASVLPDINNDGRLTPLDLLQLVNRLNLAATGEAEHQQAVDTVFQEPPVLLGLGELPDRD